MIMEAVSHVDLFSVIYMIPKVNVLFYSILTLALSFLITALIRKSIPLARHIM